MFDIRQITKSYTKHIPAGVCFLYLTLYGIILGGNNVATDIDDLYINSNATSPSGTVEVNLVIPSGSIPTEKRNFVKISLIITIVFLSGMSAFIGLTRKKTRDASSMWVQRIGRSLFYALVFFMSTLAFEEPWKSYDFSDVQLLGGILSSILFVMGSFIGIFTSKDKLSGNPLIDAIGPILKHANISAEIKDDAEDEEDEEDAEDEEEDDEEDDKDNKDAGGV